MTIEKLALVPMVKVDQAQGPQSWQVGRYLGIYVVRSMVRY